MRFLSSTAADWYGRIVVKLSWLLVFSTGKCAMLSTVGCVLRRGCLADVGMLVFAGRLCQHGLGALRLIMTKLSRSLSDGFLFCV